MSTHNAPRDRGPSRHHRTRRGLFGSACGLGFTITIAFGAIALGAAPAAAKVKAGHKVTEHAGNEPERVSKEPFGKIPSGPLQIFISINQQQLHLYSDGSHVADTLVATGLPGHATPMGVFSVIGKDRLHHSNLYSNAPMPYMQRITWSGVAMHEGVGVGHPASHGCIRMPHEFAARLWVLTKLGVRVIIARNELRPVEFADSHLFVHKDMPPSPPAPAAGGNDPVKTAQSVDGSKTTDAGALRGTEIAAATPGGTAGEAMPLPPAKPATLLETAVASHAPIAIFVSRKTKKIYVRQHFAPLFDAPIAIAQPEQPLGTHVFTALEHLADGSTFRWNVVSLPGEPAKAARNSDDDDGRSSRHAREKSRDEAVAPPTQTPEQALARVEIPQDMIDHISALMVPGSSLIVSDQDLGEETGEDTDFIVVTR